MKKRLLLLQVLMLLVAVLTPQVAWADTYYYKKADGTVVSTSDANVVEAGTNSLSSGIWVVTGSVVATERIYVNKNDVTLILLDDASLDATSGGIEVIEGGTLTITIGAETQGITGTGALTATGGSRQAGIGSGITTTSGTVNIVGGVITATGGENAAGIGGGRGASCGTVNIGGGTITATAGSYAAGIGGGYQDGGGTVNITGGTVKVYASSNASAIGGGNGGSAGTLTISGTADVIMQGNGDGVNAIYCTKASATPDEGYAVYVQDADGNNISNGTVTTPSTSQVDLIKLGLGDNIQYAHIFMEPTTYVVTYEANGGSGTMEPQSVPIGDVVTISENQFTHSELSFHSWNTAADGTGTQYIPGDEATFSSNTTLYAQWKQLVYYCTAAGDTASTVEYSVVTSSTETLTSGTWVVKGAVTASGRLNVGSNDVTLVLFDGATLDATSGGIEVVDEGKLTITVGGTTQNFDGTGALTAKSGDYQAAIGGGKGGNGGAVNILGGTIEAYAPSYASAIGGGNSGGAGALTIGGTADVIVRCDTQGYNSIWCSSATATPSEGYAVWVQDADGKDIGSTPSSSQVNLNDLGLGSSNQYAHIFMGTSAFTVTYEANGGSGTMEQTNYKVGDTIVISENQFTHSELYFHSWNTAADGTGTRYNPGDEVQFDSDITLYAQWTSTRPVYYLTAAGETVSTQEYSEVTSSTETLTSGIWVVKDNVTASKRIYVNTNNVTLILLDDATLDATTGGGIEVIGGGTLTITAGAMSQDIAGTGSLTATGGSKQAGIGGGDYGANGTINIYGGNVTATGGSQGAGIGGGSNGAGGTVNITGGIVKAYASYDSHGIGGGYLGDKGTLTISGTADVIAQGNKAYFDRFALYCSTATATPDEGYAVYVQDANGNNIGSTPSKSQVDLVSLGLSSSYLYAHIFFEASSDSCTITYNANDGVGTTNSVTVAWGDSVVISENQFTNGDLCFTSWNTAADGTGKRFNPGDKIRLLSDTTLYAQWQQKVYYVTATGDTTYTGDYSVVTSSTTMLTSGTWVVKDAVTAGKRIYVNKNDVTLILLDDATLDATAGGIEVLNGGTLTITIGDETQNIAGTGALTATGGENQAGIGGGKYGTNGTVNILGGNVTATGGRRAACIGGGDYGGGGTVNIQGGTVKAYAGSIASAIGAGWASSTKGTLTISGTADVIVQSTNDYALDCSAATATPSDGYAAFVQDVDGNDITGTPSKSQVNLLDVGLGNTYQYAHIFFAVLPESCTITYDANGGEGTMAPVTIAGGDSVVISENQFINAGLYFISWNTAADGSGTKYYPGDKAAFYRNTTLYAQWTDNNPVYYLTATGDTVSTRDYSLITSSTTTLTSGTWVVKDDVTASERIYVNRNNVTLILLDGATLDASAGGIEVIKKGTLTITIGDETQDIAGTGALTAKGGESQAGIGSGDEGNNGTINILGGNVTATGGEYAAGIGGGDCGAGGTVNISGGMVKAYAGNEASAIGGGDEGAAGTLTITGTADVIAQSYSDGYYALNCNPATATPSEGYFVYVQDEDENDIEDTPATSQVDLNALGLGDTYQYAHIFFAVPSESYTITYDANDGEATTASVTMAWGDSVVISENQFTNGDLYFTSWNTAADGSGRKYYPGDSVAFYKNTTLYAQWTDYSPVYYLTATGDTVSTRDYSVVTSSTTTLTSGTWVVKDDVTASERIYVNKNDVTLILLDDAKLDATAGGIEVLDGGTLTITIGDETQSIAGTGALTAKGGKWQAGIGSGDESNNGTINILGGNVTATGGEYAAGIGGGNCGAGGTVNISGGKVKAYAGEEAFAIGGGDEGDEGTLTITGTADVIAQSYSDGYYALNCNPATATPSEGYFVYVQDEDENDIEDTPATSQVDLNALGLGSTYQYAHIFFAPDGKIRLAEVEASGEDGTEYSLRDTLLVVSVLENNGGVIVRDYATSFMANDIADGQIDYVKDVKLQTAEWQQNNWILLEANDYTSELAERSRITGVKGTYDADAMTLTLTEEATVVDDGNESTLNNYVAANFMGTQKSDINKVTYYFVNPKPWEVAEFHWMQWDGEQFEVPTGEYDSEGNPINALELSGTVDVDWSLMGGTAPSGIETGKAYNFQGVVKLTTTTTSESAPRRAAANGSSYTVLPINLDTSKPTTLRDLTDLNHEVDHIDYVNTIGQVSTEPWEGMNIVVTHFTDGSTSTTKIVK